MGGTGLGLAILGLVIAYLAIASVWTEGFARFLGVEPQGVYGHWFLLSLWGLLCVNLLTATIGRLPWRAASLGAWASHMGVIVLAAGALRYCVLGVSGQCESWRIAPRGAASSQNGAAPSRPSAPAESPRWSPIAHFFTDRAMREAESPGAEPAAATPLPAAVQIIRAEYISQPYSSMPKDYVCDVLVTWPDGTEDRGTISLNHPLKLGTYQLSQSAWQPSGERPMTIILGVRSRPGLPMVWGGMGLILAGMLFAFHVKPGLLRRAGRTGKEAAA
jgi:hypothetical protein